MSRAVNLVKHFFRGAETSVELRQATKEELFFVANKAEVRQLYREILKATSQKMPRKLTREAKLAEIRYMFRQMAKEVDIDEINE